MKNIALLGSTGSVGRNTLKVVRHLKNKLKIVALAARSNIDLLEEQIQEFQPTLVAVFDVEKANELKKRMPGIPILAGEEGLSAVATLESANLVMLAMSGNAGLRPAIQAISAGKEIGFVNKELLVSAGELIMKKAKEKNISILPVDSEHSAIFQCLEGQDRRAVCRLILTASGGPFRTLSSEQLASITVEAALHHPNYRMGAKLTIDSSTLMNKGLEKIEAHYLFGIPEKDIDIIIHPQSLIHSLVEFQDGSMIAQMSEPNMVLPIQYALTYPDRLPGLLPRFDFLKNCTMTFEPPDRKKFPCLLLAEEALKQGQSYPCALNAANEVLVERFLRGEHRWIDIGRKLEKLMSSHCPVNMLSLDQILAVDQQIREQAKKA